MQAFSFPEPVVGRINDFLFRVPWDSQIPGASIVLIGSLISWLSRSQEVAWKTDFPATRICSACSILCLLYWRSVTCERVERWQPETVLSDVTLQLSIAP